MSALDLVLRVRQNPHVLVRKRSALLVLFTVLALPHLFAPDAYAFALQGHAHGTDDAEWSGLAQALVHGHAHQDGVPAHEHHLLPSPTLLMHVLQAPQPALSALKTPGPEGPVPAASRAWEQKRWEPTGSSPPLLHLLCTLLI
jgi:hypothetical protein